MKKLDELKKSIVNSGSVSMSDVQQLRKIVYSDGKVNRAEADFLFDLKDDINDFGLMKSWNAFFIKAICDHILDGAQFKDDISYDDTQWLINRIGKDHYIDNIEEKLLKNLHKRIKNFPVELTALEKRESILRKIGYFLLKTICGSSPTAHSLETGISRNGMRKPSPFI